MTRCLIAFMWLLHWLPYPWQVRVGHGLGRLLYVLAVPRRKVALRNLALCFPDVCDVQRRQWCRTHLRLWTQTFLDRGTLWFASRERLERLIQVEGWEHVEAARPENTGRPWMIFTPHFVGLDAGGMAVLLRQRLVSVYVQPPNKVLDQRLRAGRSRFAGSELYSRSVGVRPVIKAMKRGLPYFVLPDMDLGRHDSVFVDFFGVSAATVTVMPRLARSTNAVVVPLVVRVNEDGSGYTARFYPPWMDYPGAMDEAAGARAMNAFIEARVREMPSQYYWVHRRFKTRPPGEPSLY